MSTFSVEGPDGTTIEFPEGTAPDAIKSAFAKIGAPSAAAAAPLAAFDPNDVRFENRGPAAALRGVPLLGAGVNRAGAALSALAHPLTGVGSDGESIGDRYSKNLAQEDAAQADYEKQHPVKSAVEGMVGGGLALGGAAGAVPAVAKGLGMVGPLRTAIPAAIASGGALGGADAALRGEDATTGALTGALTGAGGAVAGKVAGKVWDAARGMFRDAPVVPTRTIPVNGVDVPVRESVVTRNPRASELEQADIHGGNGPEAQAAARAHGELTDAGMGQAHSDLAASLDPTGTSPSATPMAAGEAVGSEVAAQEAARAAAEARRLQGVGNETQAIREDLNTSATPGVLADTPRTAAEVIQHRLTQARDAAAAARDRAYDDLRTTKGEFNPAVFRDTAQRIREHLSGGSDPVNVTDTLTPHTAQALRDIDRNVGQLRFENQARETPVVASGEGQTARDVEDIRKKFGDQVASAFERQQHAPAAAPLPEVPKAQSLLEFIASKGGLGPDAELNAIGAHGHTVNVEGAGRRKLVRQGGWPLDYAREAAEEAGYLRGDHSGTSTVNDLLDAIDAEVRGKKRYPEGHEGHVGKREGRAISEREQHELDARNRGFEEDLATAGHGDVGGDVKKRAIHLMSSEKMDADSAVEHALRQLEQEDHALGSTFPGDKPRAAGAAAPVPEAEVPPITAGTIDEARKRLISMQRAANDTARRTGDFSDVRGMRRIIAAFDDHVARAARTPEGFSGDAKELLDRLQGARAAHTQLKRTFGPANPQDQVGKAIEKIVGKRGVDSADPEAVKKLIFGGVGESGGSPGVGAHPEVAGRIIDMFGENSPQHAAIKQGLLSHLADTPAGLDPMSHAKVADRVAKFFDPNSKSASLANRVFGLNERARLLNHANRMRAAADPAPSNFVEKTVAKWAGRDGGLRASPKTIVDDLIGSTGAKGTSPMLVQHLRRELSPEAYGKLKQGVWSRITESAEGKTSWQDQKVGNRIMEFLNGDGKGLADAMFTDGERAAMRQIGDAHIANLPIEGTTNPSKSGHVMQRLARGAAHGILPFVGLHAGGLPGVAGAMAINKGLSKVVDRAAANAARVRFYGPQAQAAPSRLPQRFGALSGALAAEQSR